MYLQIFFIIFSLGCGGAFWWFTLPALQNKNDLLFKLLVYPYPFFKKFLPYPDYTYFILLSIFVAFLLWILCEIIYLSTKEKPITTWGIAHYATKKEVKDLIQSKGVPVGRLDGKILRVDKTHLVTCAGTRSGKGIGAIIPTLLEYPDSWVCLDVKGENYAVTGNRRKKFGKVFVLNPFDVLDFSSNSYNWLDSINLNDPGCVDKALRIASILVGGSSDNGVENHFNEHAKTLIQGVILLVADEKEELRNMLTVAKLIRRTPFEQLCQLMINKGDLSGGEVGNIGAQFLNNTNDKELSGIISTAQRAVRNLTNPQISKTLIKSDFDISKLPDEKMSIYLIMPTDKVSDFKDYIKVFFELAFSSIVSRKKRGKYEVLFLFDEVAQLGYMDSFPKLITLVKGLGAQLWFFFQDIAQIKSIYGDEAGTILGNSTQIYYGCNDLDTAKTISERIGKKTQREYKKNGEFSDKPKSLIEPSEFLQLPPDTPLILMQGKPAIMVKRLNYLQDKEYRDKFDKNPYFT